MSDGGNEVDRVQDCSFKMLGFQNVGQYGVAWGLVKMKRFLRQVSPKRVQVPT